MLSPVAVPARKWGGPLLDQRTRRRHTPSPPPPQRTSEREAATRLALRKARAVAAGLAEGLVLGADTLVVIDGDALGKPADPDEARRMLRRLRGRAHEVITGVALVDARTGRTRTAAELSRVLMTAYPDALIEAYVASGGPFDKAGGYALQELGGALVARVEGSYTNVVGLPLAVTRRLLSEGGVLVSGARRT